jgi:transposase
LDKYPISANSLGKYFQVNGKNLSQQYKHHLSDYQTWQQKDHAEDWILYPDNIGEVLCLDEVVLSQGELYTVLTNAHSRTQQNSLIAMIKGVRSKDVIKILKKIPQEQRAKVQFISVDMANNMERIAKKSFQKAKVVTDRFHVAKLIGDAVQQIRIKYRWEAIEKENNEIEQAKKTGKKYKTSVFENGDSPKQLLARSRHLLFKTKVNMTENQKERAKILFKHYPKIEQAYKISMIFRNIYETSKTKEEATQKLNKWFSKVKSLEMTEFNTAAKSVKNHLENILNYFPQRITNSLAENFNSKIKAFRASFRGVRDIKFFLYRIAIIFA